MALHPDRTGRLTASNHAVPLGHGYQSPQAFWRRWHGMEEPDEQAKVRMQWGVEHEPDALAAYEELTGDIVTHCLDRQEFIAWEDWCGATPDGRTQLGIVEFKCPQRMYETPPLQYWIQVQSQLVMTDEGVADLCAWTPDAVSIWRTRKVNNYWNDVEPTLKAYWECLTSGMEPRRGQFKKVSINHLVQWERIA